MAAVSASSTRATFLVTGVGAAAATSFYLASLRPTYAEEQRSRREKFSVYSEEAPPVTLVEYHTELEKQIGSVRKSIRGATQDTQNGLRGIVSRWIDTERSVEARVKQLVAKDEPLTPGILYVGVATLAGSVFGRYRSLPIRLISPPVFFLASLNFFLPKFSHNLSDYYVSLEKAHVPALTEQREKLLESYRSARKGTEQQLGNLKHTAESSLQSGLQQVEQSTGLKVGNALGDAKQKAKATLGDKKLV